MSVTRPLFASSIALALMLVPPTDASAQRSFEGVITYRMGNGRESADVKVMSKGPVTRMEIQGQGMPGGMVMLMNGEKQVMQMIMASMGMYMEMDMRQAAQMAAQAAPAEAGDLPSGFKLEKVGTPEEVAGIRCENYRFIQSGQPETEACIASGMGYWMGGMAAPQASRAPVPSMGPDFSAFMKEFKDGMVPLRVRVKEGNNWKTVMEATAVERQSLGDDLFVVPPGLRKMGMPDTK